jgi:glycosyltransferase involved in cell wall biosynthesis
VRILHLTDHYPPVSGGIESHVAGLADRQAREGNDVTVLTSAPRTAEGHTRVDTGPVEVIRVRSVLEGLRVDVESFDLVHGHVSVVAPVSAPLISVFAALTGMRGAPVTWTAVSRIAASEVRRRLPGDTPVHVVPNAVDAPPRTETPASEGQVNFISTMRIAHRKRPLQLLRIFDHVRVEARLPVSLTVVGDGPLRNRFERLVGRLDLGGHVHVTGRLPPAGVLDHLARSDVYVAPAVLESFGLAALEARGVGLPVVGRLGTGVADFIEDRVDGLLCASDAEVSDQLVGLADDADARRQMSEHNRTVEHGMSWARSLEIHERIYSLACESRLQAALEP